MGKDYTVKNLEKAEETNNVEINQKIRNNIIFAIAAFLLAGVSFGIGDELFGSTSLQNIVAFGSVGISGANIRALKNNLKLKSESKSKKVKTIKNS